MKIKEICQKCGLSERTVRYYCEQKLIEVESYTQNGREYLNFSEKNAEELRAIAVLRQADFSIDEIRSMICEPHLIRRIVGEHTRTLADRSRESDRVVEAFLELDTMHLASVEDVVRVLENKPAHSTVAALKPGEMTFSEFCEASGYCRDDSLFLEDDRRVVRGRRIFIVYMIFAITNMVLSLITGFAEPSLLFSNLISIVLMAVVLFYLYKGYTWARIVTGILHGARTFFLLFMAGDAFPTAYVQNHGSLSESGEWTSQVITVYPTATDWLVFSFLLVCLLFEAACLYFVCFHKGVREYLYNNYTSY